MGTPTSVGDLRNEELNAVCFVMDYVEFHFNGPVLRSLTNPVVASSAGTNRFPEPGSRDAFCALIGAKVHEVEVREQDAIRVRFAGGEMLTIPLDLNESPGPEAAHFVPGINQGIQVW